VHVGFFGTNGLNGAQAEALRIPFADGTRYPLPVGEDDALMPSLLTLSDVMGTGHHAAVVVCERGEVAIERVRELTGGQGVHAVLECVGHGASMDTAIGIARPGGAVGRVGVPQHTEIPGSLPAFFGNITIGGGPAPVRAYLDELLPDVLAGRIEPGRVFDRTVGLDGVPDGYRVMADREAIKGMVTP
jgi:threonine dehydrogenase-like Zn-dependent dehydrogenase